MDSSFFRNRCWYEQPDSASHPLSRSPSYRGVPVYHVDPTREIQRPSYPIPRSPERITGARLVQIPVHYVGTEQVDRTGSALKIQKVFRGFLVRKCLKKIKEIKVQVDEIEERLLKSDVVEMVRRDERERLRMNESLMSLLFKLDSICGVDFGVRGCRKAVIRKAIALQERIDAIVGVSLQGNGETVDQDTEIKASDSSHQSDDPAKPKDLSENVESQGILEDGSRVGGEVDHIDDPVKPKDSSENVEFQGTLEDGSCAGEQIDHTMKDEVNDGEDDIIDVGVDREVKVIETNCDGNGGAGENLDSVEESPSDRDDKNKSDNGLEKEDWKQKGGNGADDNRRNQELLERMMEDNEKMMSLVTQLFERNEAQMRMLNALTNRVELLEKAFVCDKQRRKKKGKANSSRDV